MLDSSSKEYKLIKNLEKEFEENQSLMEHSLLNSDDIPHLPLDSSRLSAHIHGDTVIDGTNLEGSQLSTTAAYLVGLLKEIAKTSEKETQEKIKTLIKRYEELIKLDSKWQNLATQLKEAAEIDRPSLLKKASLNLAEQIFDLKSDQELLVPGGWSGTPAGHAMLYLFTRNNNKEHTYDITIFNTGAGANYHENLILGNKDRICPLVKYEGVTAEELFFATEKKEIKPDLFKKLIELQVVPKVDQKISVKAEEVYAAFMHLEEKRSLPDQALIGFSTAQRSGTCAWKVLLPCTNYFLSKEFKKTDEKLPIYKSIKHQIDLISLVSFYRDIKKSNKLKEDSQGGFEARYLLKVAAKKLARSTAKLYQLEKNKSAISEIKAKKCYATALELVNLTEEIELELQNNVSKVSDDLSDERLDVSTDLEKQRVETSKQLQEMVSSPQKRTEFIDTSSVEKIEVPKEPKELKLFLTNFQDTYLTKEKDKNLDEKTGIRMAIEQLVDQIPFPDFERSEESYWQKIPKEDLQDCIDSLNKIMSRYLVLANQPKMIFPTQQNTLYSLYAMVHSLALSINQTLKNAPQLADYGIYFPLELIQEDKYCRFYNEKSYSQRNKILTYFTHYSQNCLFDLYKIEPMTENTFIEAFPDYKYLEELYDSNSSYFSNKFTQLKNYRKKKEENRYEEKMGIEKVAERLGYDRAIIAYMHMETLSQEDEGNRILCSWNKNNRSFDSKYQFLLTLKEAAAKICFSVSANNEGLNEEESHEAKLSSNWKVNKPEFSLLSDSFSKTRENSSYEMHRSIPTTGWYSDCKPTFDQYFKCEIEKVEGEVQGHNFGQSISAIGQRGVLSSCEADLQPAILLQHALENLELFENPDPQTLFELLFFRDIRSNKKDEKAIIFYPLLKQIATEPELIEQATQLILKGVKRYHDLCPKNQPKIFPCLFFLRLASRLKAILAEAQEENRPVLEFEEQKLLREWLDIDSLTDEEKAAIHLHLLTSYTYRPTEKLTKEALQEIIISWNLLQRAKENKQWEDPAQKEAVTKWFYQEIAPLIENKFAKDVEFCTNTLNQTLKAATGFDNKTGCKWAVCKDPRYKLKYNDLSFWEINCITGTIRNELGIIGEKSTKEISNQGDYNRLFKNQIFTGFAVNRTLQFQTPQYGRVQSYRTDIKSGDLRFQKQSENGAWAEYIQPKHLKTVLPYTLIAGHSHWISLDKSSEIVMEIRDLKDGHLVATQDDKGKIRLINTESELVTFKDQIQKPLTSRLKLFEREQYSHCEKKEQFDEKKNETITNYQIKLPRYCSLEGNPLSFVADNLQPEWKWSENSQLQIIPEQIYQKKYLGNLPNFIALGAKSITGKTKISKLLVPLKEIKKNEEKEITSQTYLEVNDEPFLDRINYRDYNEFDQRQEGRYRYLEFDLKNGRIAPQNTEGRLFLSYLALVEKDYLKALDYLKQIKRSDLLSAESREILDWILFSHKKIADNSPNGAAIRLKTAALLYRATERDQIVSKEEKEPKKLLSKEIKKQIDADLHIYVESLNNIDKKIALQKKYF